MANKKLKTYTVDGQRKEFDSMFFEELFKKKRRTEKIGVCDLETDIADKLSVSPNTVHVWRFNQNGPVDLEMIKNLAKYFGVSDFKSLLKDSKEEKTVQITERQRDSLKRIYDMIIRFLNEFMISDGFNNYWHTLCKIGENPDNVENDLYMLAEKLQHDVEVTMLKEYIVLHKLDIYSRLEEFVTDDLTNMYDGKLSHAYRFEAPVEKKDGTRDTVTTEEDYAIALKKINDMLEEYF